MPAGSDSKASGHPNDESKSGSVSAGAVVVARSQGTTQGAGSEAKQITLITQNTESESAGNPSLSKVSGDSGLVAGSDTGATNEPGTTVGAVAGTGGRRRDNGKRPRRAREMAKRGKDTAPEPSAGRRGRRAGSPSLAFPYSNQFHSQLKLVHTKLTMRFFCFV
jgi:hypothetical protein